MELASPHWKKLTNEEKDKYRSEADRSGLEENDLILKKVSRRKRRLQNSLGEYIDDIQRRRKIDKENHGLIIQEIHSMIATGHLGGF